MPIDLRAPGWLRGLLAALFAFELLLAGAWVAGLPLAIFFRHPFRPLELVSELALSGAAAGYFALALRRLLTRRRALEEWIVLLLPAAGGWVVFMDFAHGRVGHPIATGAELAALPPSPLAIVADRVRCWLARERGARQDERRG